MRNNVIRIDGNGPAGIGLQPLDLDPADFQSPLPRQHAHEYFGDEEAGLSVGVWDTTTMQEAFGPYPGDEFIVVLEGAFAMVDGKGGAVRAKAGDSVCFRNAIPTSWKQDGYLKKIYLTWRAPDAVTPQIDSATDGVVVLTAADTGSVVFCNDTGNMVVWHIANRTMNQPQAASAAHELVQVLQGEVEITEPPGASQRFSAGEVFFVPQGTVCGWSSPNGFSAYRVSLSLPAVAVSDRA
jgi:uncharacterized cupin superfamily protein